MNTKLIYKAIAGVYDLLDVIYFRNKVNSPRKAVLKRINESDVVLDLCTGTATNALSIAKSRRFGLEITSYEHCDYTKVIALKKHPNTET